MATASKSSRRSTAFSQASTTRMSSGSARTGTPDVEETAGGGRDVGSPLSPTRMSRIQEKQQLAHLNDRLAQYIDRVKTLEAENARLNYQMIQSEEVITRERKDMKAAYEAELADARKLLDETAKEKARLQIDADKNKAEYEDKKNRIKNLEKDLRLSEDQRLYRESQVADLQAKISTSEDQRKHWENEAKKLRGENDALHKQLETGRKQLEEETLLRVDLENRLQSAREELAFNKNLYEQELEETRQRKQTEIKEIGRDLEDQFQTQLQEQLRDMRAQFDAQLRSNRKEVEAMYEKKLRDMEDYAENQRETANNYREESRQMKSSLDQFEKDRNDYEKKVETLERKVKDLTESLTRTREDCFTRLNAKEEELNRLREENKRMMDEYRDLLDTKIQLDVELEAYRRLLEGEETRLNLSPSGTPASSERRGTKRRRLQETESEAFDSYTTKAEAVTDVEVLDHDISGKYVTLHNKSEEDISIGGWTLSREAGGVVVEYKFSPKQKIKAGTKITVWSADAGKTHSPPSDLVFKHGEVWPTGERVRSFLEDQAREEVAWRESVRGAVRSRFSFRSGYASGVEVGDEADQRCAIM